jgi:hypothetical protein
MWADKRYVMGHGRVFALYAALYCSARGLIETMRIDDAHHILGIRLNVFTALIVGALALLYLIRSSEKNPGRELMSGGKLVFQGQDREISPVTNSETPASTTPSSLSVEEVPEVSVEEVPEVSVEEVPENSDPQPNSSPAVQVDKPRERGRRAKPKR